MTYIVRILYVQSVWQREGLTLKDAQEYEEMEKILFVDQHIAFIIYNVQDIVWLFQEEILNRLGMHQIATSDLGQDDILEGVIRSVDMQ